ncbi:CDP-alcohol phosphatidyltransferase [Nitrosococcus halophilus Nc 4]|uniref:CDP-diacylglycerol--glycerol-3-phosphate 3-phosphatidyltransferase n=1 Tax=Nitrosococcus halophilus (strain Nc4) TaxID=472759 RepID=D5BY68_NITHN|nr:CDP-alcohol phosphatidyltransferase family protein [Nitrosococcus halophilus]ADE14051.1 CDP-alcohol phosphatidyltransferase [Nitrosococcus halophilus Nc 4]
MQVRNIPNLLTVIRILLVAPLIYVLLQEDYFFALWIILMAGASDGVDGFLAKHYHWQSRLGSILDPLADKLLLISSFIVLAWLGHLPYWLVLLALGRDLVIVLGGLAYHFWVGPFEMEPVPLSKLNTLCQILLVVAVMISQLPGLDIPQLTGWFIYLVALTTLLSGMQYIWHWGGQAWRVSRTQKAGPESCRQRPETTNHG